MNILPGFTPPDTQSNVSGTNDLPSTSAPVSTPVASSPEPVNHVDSVAKSVGLISSPAPLSVNGPDYTPRYVIDPSMMHVDPLADLKAHQADYLMQTRGVGGDSYHNQVFEQIHDQLLQSKMSVPELTAQINSNSMMNKASTITAAGFVPNSDGSFSPAPPPPAPTSQQQQVLDQQKYLASIKETVDGIMNMVPNAQNATLGQLQTILNSPVAMPQYQYQPPTPVEYALTALASILSPKSAGTTIEGEYNAHTRMSQDDFARQQQVYTDQMQQRQQNIQGTEYMANEQGQQYRTQIGTQETVLRGQIQQAENAMRTADTAQRMDYQRLDSFNKDALQPNITNEQRMTDIKNANLIAKKYGWATQSEDPAQVKQFGDQLRTKQTSDLQKMKYANTQDAETIFNRWLQDTYNGNITENDIPAIQQKKHDLEMAFSLDVGNEGDETSGKAPISGTIGGAEQIHTSLEAQRLMAQTNISQQQALTIAKKYGYLDKEEQRKIHLMDAQITHLGQLTQQERNAGKGTGLRFELANAKITQQQIKEFDFQIKGMGKRPAFGDAKTAWDTKLKALQDSKAVKVQELQDSQDRVKGMAGEEKQGAIQKGVLPKQASAAYDQTLTEAGISADDNSDDNQ